MTRGLRIDDATAREWAGRGIAVPGYEHFMPGAGAAGEQGRPKPDHSTAPDRAPAPRFRSKLEAAYATYLDATMSHADGTGRIVTGWKHEAVRLRIGGESERCWFTPDFLVETAGGQVEIHEIKGSSKVAFLAERRRSGIVRLKAAAVLYPWALWFLVTRAEDGGWRWRRVAG